MKILFWNVHRREITVAQKRLDRDKEKHEQRRQRFEGTPQFVKSQQWLDERQNQLDLQHRQIADMIVPLIREKEIDIALFAECPGNAVKLISQRISGFSYVNCPGCDKIEILCKQSLQPQARRGAYRCAIISVGGANPMIIGGIHLSAMDSGREKRLDEIPQIVEDIKEEEKLLSGIPSLIIGDFNANPFDLELVGHRYFNAVLYKDLINTQEVIRWNRKNRMRFYNPLLHFISEDSKMYGSYYYEKDNRPLYWNCLDQVIVRQPLVDSIKNVEYLKSIDTDSLLNEAGQPDEKYSDHLPLLVELEFGGNFSGNFGENFGGELGGNENG